MNTAVAALSGYLITVVSTSFVVSSFAAPPHAQASHPLIRYATKSRRRTRTRPDLFATKFVKLATNSEC